MISEEEPSCSSDEEDECFVNIHQRFQPTLDKIRELKKSSPRVPKETQAAVDKVVEVFRKAVRGVRRNMREKYAEVEKLKAVEKAHSALEQKYAALERAHSALVREYESLHAKAGPDTVTIKFMQSDSENSQAVSCNRSLVRHWSSAMEALMRHGNGMQGECPQEVTLGDADADSFKAALAFKTTGQLPLGVVRPLFKAPAAQTSDMHAEGCANDKPKDTLENAEGEEQLEDADEGKEEEEEERKKEEKGKTQDEEKASADVIEQSKDAAATSNTTIEHPLLRFADVYDLADLRTEYLREMRERSVLDDVSVAAYLELAMRYNAHALRDEAADFIAKKCKKATGQFAPFLELSASAASVVLGQDNLPMDKETDVLHLVHEWVKHKAGRDEQASELVSKLRFELVSLAELVDLPEGIGNDHVLAKAKPDIVSAIDSAVKCKLSGGSGQNLRKRKHTIFDPSVDESYLKVARFLGRGAAGA
eukprot:TRINITY_DN65364_c0_g1_i1.p1 TRINITY_DN65364_c0_g1~~TRINITY_DN65364_c0_g1_i1.p1  ORF type:complete len:479 (+),score=105.35 TRINITY_DN65364_c0_g1_i1:63-1499(+)